MIDMSKGNKILGFIVAILVLGVSTFGGVYFYLTKVEGTETVKKEVVIEEAFHDIGEIFVNLNDDKVKRYVKLKLSVSFNKGNENLATEISEKQVVMRDVSIYYLKSLTADAFEPENEEKLKSDLIGRLNQKLTKGAVLEVYISEIIVQ